MELRIIKAGEGGCQGPSGGFGQAVEHDVDWPAPTGWIDAASSPVVACGLDDERGLRRQPIESLGQHHQRNVLASSQKSHRSMPTLVELAPIDHHYRGDRAGRGPVTSTLQKLGDIADGRSHQRSVRRGVPVDDVREKKHPLPGTRFARRTEHDDLDIGRTMVSDDAADQVAGHRLGGRSPAGNTGDRATEQGNFDRHVMEHPRTIEQSLDLGFRRRFVSRLGCEVEAKGSAPDHDPQEIIVLWTALPEMHAGGGSASP